ncbi:protein kinase [Streptomyces sp. NPDC050658]|uniref:protein kinase domain-containing protein n=1 Tax=unclassified Streptomyces TaxID=2593676 RepID=UPI003421602A
MTQDHFAFADQPFAVEVPYGYRVGNWEVREPIASGAFGSVYAARRTEPDTDGLPAEAALKFLPTGSRTPRQLRHLQELADRELKLLSKLRRPRLIRMYEALTVDDPENPALDGATVMALERAEGSLDTLIARSDPGPLPSGGPILAQICEGLSQLHRAGWVHGDLKPGNVLLLREAQVRLADFNLAAEMEGTHAYSLAFATPDYTPPELLWAEIGERGQLIRPTADIWAFGVVAHLVLTGTLPFPGTTSAARKDALLRYARGAEELRLSPELPAPWREIVTDCLAPTHERRAPHSSESLLRRVEEAAGTDPAPRLPRLRPWPLRPRRRRTAVAAALAVAAVLGGTGYGMATLTTGTGSPNPPAPKPVAPASYGASELTMSAGVPVKYRKLIVDAAHDCREKTVTPALVAALLKVESDFDPDLKDTATNEYGIARWSPDVLRYYLPDTQRPEHGDPKPPFPPKTSIPAVGRYLCQIAPRLWSTVPGDRRVLTAVAYRTSFGTVNKEGGVPERHREYAERIAHYLKKYTPEA